MNEKQTKKETTMPTHTCVKLSKFVCNMKRTQLLIFRYPVIYECLQCKFEFSYFILKSIRLFSFSVFIHFVHYFVRFNFCDGNDSMNDGIEKESDEMLMPMK